MHREAASQGRFAGGWSREVGAWGSAVVLAISAGLDDARGVGGAHSWLAALPRLTGDHDAHIQSAGYEDTATCLLVALALDPFERDGAWALVVS